MTPILEVDYENRFTYFNITKINQVDKCLTTVNSQNLIFAAQIIFKVINDGC